MSVAGANLKRKSQMADAHASKHVKMAELEVAFDHSEEKNVCSRVGRSLVD